MACMILYGCDGPTGAKVLGGFLGRLGADAGHQRPEGQKLDSAEGTCCPHLDKPQNMFRSDCLVVGVWELPSPIWIWRQHSRSPGDREEPRPCGCWVQLFDVRVTAVVRARF